RLPEVLRQLPPERIGELHGRRHVLRIAGRHSAVHPADNRRDLLVAEAPVVLELLNADRPIDVPRRHEALRHLALDLVRVLARILVRHERHRADRIGLMADLALLLEDRRHVPGERDGRRRRRRRVMSRREERDGKGGDAGGCDLHDDGSSMAAGARRAAAGSLRRLAWARYITRPLRRPAPFRSPPHLTTTFRNPFVQQHCAWPAPVTPDASLARTRTR